jgi:hypothetical protein
MSGPEYSRWHAHGVVSLVVEQGDDQFLIGIYRVTDQPITGTLHGAQEMADNLAQCPRAPMHAGCEPWQVRRSARKNVDR